jgi:transcriptional regulator with XRE-family HTH domain
MRNRATRLRSWRRRRGLTLLEVADLTGLSVPMLSRLERGERRVRPETKVRIARRLGVRIADLFEEGSDG